MIKLENFEVVGWEHAIRGMRNPMNSWEKSDSDYRRFLSAKCEACGKYKLPDDDSCDDCWVNLVEFPHKGFIVGPNDHSLMMKLRNAGTDHRKFMRQIIVYVDITAPLYWWKEFDTYKVGTVANSCSTMHKIHEKEFTWDDFSHEHLCNYGDIPFDFAKLMGHTIESLNAARTLYLNERDKRGGESAKRYWWQMIQLLPTSYNQKRTVMMNYENLANMYKSRKNHKLDEWHVLCDWIEGLPYSELIIGGEKDESN